MEICLIFDIVCDIAMIINITADEWKGNGCVI
jgi:hypothetical protein